MAEGFRDLMESLAGHPALRGLTREEVARALYVQDKHVLPAEIMGLLGRTHAVVMRPADPKDVERAVKVATGELTTTALGLSARDYHFVRTQLGVRRGYEVPVDYMRTVDLFDDQVLPQQGGFLLDLSALNSIQILPPALAVRAGVGARWKDVQDQALAAGFTLETFPLVPMDYALGDLPGTPLASIGGEASGGMRNVDAILPDGSPASLGYDEVPNNGSGYDLVQLFRTGGQHLFIPYSFTLGLRPRPKATKTLLYTFPDLSTLAASLRKLSGSRVRPWRVLFYDEVGWASSRRSEASGPVLEVTLSGSDVGVPLMEKALDTLAEGRSAKAEAVSILDAPAEEFRRSVRPLRSAVAEVQCTPSRTSEVYGVVSSLTPGLGVMGALSRSTVSVVPTLRRPLSRRERFDFVANLLKGIGDLGIVSGPQILLLLDEGGPMVQGFRVLRRIKEKVDLPNTVNPARALLYSPKP